MANHANVSLHFVLQDFFIYWPLRPCLWRRIIQTIKQGMCAGISDIFYQSVPGHQKCKVTFPPLWVLSPPCFPPSIRIWLTLWRMPVVWVLRRHRPICGWCWIFFEKAELPREFAYGRGSWHCPCPGWTLMDTRHLDGASLPGSQKDGSMNGGTFCPVLWALMNLLLF